MSMPLSLFAVAALLTSLLGTQVVGAPNDEEDVRNVVAGFETARNHHDTNAFGKLFAPDADFVNVAALRWKGRQAIQAQHAYTHGTMPADSPGSIKEDRPYYGVFKTSTLRFTQTDVRFPDAAFSFLSGSGVDPTGRSRLPLAR
jgi:hypothetical protein